MKKRVKVFQAGNYPQGNYSKEKVNEIFGTAGRVDGIYAHTSKWAEKGEEPLKVAEFSDFKVTDGVVTALVEFNEKGQGYFNDSVIKGVSVEIRDNKLSKVALLPIGVKPQVAGAEFAEEEYAEIEFEVIEEFEEAKIDVNSVKDMNLDDKVAIITAIFGSLTNDEKEGIRQLYWADFEKKEPEQPQKIKTEAEIRAEITAEFERKEKGNALKQAMKKKVVPCLQSIVEFAIDEALMKSGTVEFEAGGKKENVSYFEKIEKEIEALPDAANFQSEVERMEFGEFEEGAGDDPMAKAHEEVKKMLGGK
ncbi:hypothetical protein [Fusobacterium necrophorum]|uniref:Uncharacterized protein n=1 Tax=Fusobacterium necrophorum subsp. funduliforme TaxID=143387 RepID=A0A162IRQ7_9FUSO|nr:hypothetical protein [Fusobacterium necrophorum]KYL04338.1 hypothetical protein A2J07_10705 [Fusobacterium necrophorum subsp. funduliforme]KYM55992.1 hypothetical protein A2U07_11035 [Fusobacterium necrophorum subsp. funduliforme]